MYVHKISILQLFEALCFYRMNKGVEFVFTRNLRYLCPYQKREKSYVV